MYFSAVPCNNSLLSFRQTTNTTKLLPLLQLLLQVVLLFTMSSFVQMATKSTSLFIVSKKDLASVNMATQLIRRYDWKEVTPRHPHTTPINTDSLLCTLDPNQRILTCPRLPAPSSSQKKRENVLMWIVNDPLLPLNHAHDLFLQRLLGADHTATPLKIEDILFLSRHAAASGTLSLTVHPIGIPGVLEGTENAIKSGGIPGKCSPPSPHIAALYRLILAETKEQGIDNMFQVTLEATHHGPYVSIPACFVEIGSSEAEWDNKEAGIAWAQCLGDYFHMKERTDIEKYAGWELDQVLETPVAVDELDLVQAVDVEEDKRSVEEVVQSIDEKNEIVVVTIGGGHYVPKMNDLARLGESVYVGHALASYALADHWPPADQSISVEGNPKWRQVLVEAIESTRTAHPDKKIYCFVDKKAFIAAQRDVITNTLEQLAVDWTFKATDIKNAVTNR